MIFFNQISVPACRILLEYTLRSFQKGEKNWSQEQSRAKRRKPSGTNIKEVRKSNKKKYNKNKEKSKDEEQQQEERDH